MCDGSRGACGAGSTHVESSRCPTNPILDGEIWTLNENDDDDDLKEETKRFCESFCMANSYIRDI